MFFMFPLKSGPNFIGGSHIHAGEAEKYQEEGEKTRGKSRKCWGRARNCGGRQKNVVENVVANTFNKIKNLLD
jgi:hypothetical protein